jgi:hypothetical protein
MRIFNVFIFTFVVLNVFANDDLIFEYNILYNDLMEE